MDTDENAHTPGPANTLTQHPPPGVPHEERTFGMAVHLSALAGLLVPFGTFLGPLVMWLIKKDSSRFVDDQGKEAVNFQGTLAIAMLVVSVFMVFAFVLTIILIGLPLLLLAILAYGVLAVLAYVFAVIAAMKANEGIWYRYPFAIRFFK